MMRSERGVHWCWIVQSHHRPRSLWGGECELPRRQVELKRADLSVALFSLSSAVAGCDFRVAHPDRPLTLRAVIDEWYCI